MVISLSCLSEAEAQEHQPPRFVADFRGGQGTRRLRPTNLELAFGGVLRHFRLDGAALHEDNDSRGVTVLTDDERPVVFYREERRPTEPLARSKRERQP